MVKEIYGKKLGMTQIFGENGEAIPVTVIEVAPLTVVSKKTIEKDGYNALVVSFGEIKEKNVNKPMKGIFAKAKAEVARHLKEIKVEDIESYEIGSKIDISIFNEIKFVDVSGTSKGKGFAGVIKRYNQSRGPMSHGSMYHRRVGSMNSGTSPSRVYKNKKLPGHMGNKLSTILNLDLVKIDMDKNVLLIKGSVPGAKKSVVKVRKAIK